VNGTRDQEGSLCRHRLLLVLAIFPLVLASVGLLALIHASGSLVRGRGIRKALPGDAKATVAEPPLP